MQGDSQTPEETSQAPSPVVSGNMRLKPAVRGGSEIVVTVKGKQPRKDAHLMHVAVPPDLNDRLEEETAGSVSTGIVALARYALENLDNAGLMLNAAIVQEDQEGEGGDQEAVSFDPPG